MRNNSHPRARFIGGTRSVNLISFCFFRSSASSLWLFIRALISSSRLSFLARKSCRDMRLTHKCDRSPVRRTDPSMTSGCLMCQKSSPLPRSDALGNIVAAISLKSMSTRSFTQKKCIAPFVWAFKCYKSACQRKGRKGQPKTIG
jgi:hypothetical protein